MFYLSIYLTKITCPPLFTLESICCDREVNYTATSRDVFCWKDLHLLNWGILLYKIPSVTNFFRKCST